MKFPLPKNIFPPVELTSGQEEQFERLANSLIKETIDNYDRFVRNDKQRVDRHKWKVIKKREGVTVYKEREHGSRNGSLSSASKPYTSSSMPTLPSWESSSRASSRMTAVSSPSNHEDRASEIIPGPMGFEATIGLSSSAFSIIDSHLQPQDSNLPKLLVVGSIPGSLDDVMYGIVSPNASAVRVKTSYFDDDIVDCNVLCEIKAPTTLEPFRFLGIKWLVKQNRRAVKKIVWPRDFVLLEYSGVMLRPNGDRLGFHLMHSVEIPMCHELIDRNILRAKLSSCYIYKELPNGSVNLYMTAKVEPRGNVFESLALRSAATALSSCWKSVKCAQNKKLAWLLQNEDNHDNYIRQSARVTQLPRGSSDNESVGRTSSSVGGNKKQCGVCIKPFGAFAKIMTCQLCYEQICYRCRVVRKLSAEALDTVVMKTSMVFCKKCVTNVSDESALEIAKQEVSKNRARGRTRTSSTNIHVRATTKEQRNRDRADSFASERSTYSSIVHAMDAHAGDDAPYSTRSNDDYMRRSFSTPAVGSVSLIRSVSAPRMSDGGKDIPWRPSVSRGTGTTDGLSLADLEVDDRDDQQDEPVLLNAPVRKLSLRHMDYIIQPPTNGDSGAATTVNATVDDGELEESTTSSHYDESEGRLSHDSSVAFLDSEYEFDDQSTNFHPEQDQFDEEDETEEQPVLEDDENGDESSTSTALTVFTSSTEVVKTTSSTFVPPLDDDDDVSRYQNQRKPSYQMQLWMQMNDLRDAAEKTYQVAKSNTEAHLPPNSNPIRPMRTFSQPFNFNVVGLRSTRAMSFATPPKKPIAVTTSLPSQIPEANE